MSSYLIKTGLLSAAVLFLFLFIRYFEKKNLYFPLSTIEATPEDIGLEYEEIYLTTEDGVRISGWFIPAANPRATVIFSHGNGGNISHRLEKIVIFNKLNLNMLIFDYRGYGLSKGIPSEEGLYLDAEAMLDYLADVRKIPAENIIAYGESLGGAVALHLATEYKLKGVILEGSFSSVRDMAKKIFPFIPAFIYKSKYDSLEKIRRIKSPKLIFHSTEDGIVPVELGKKIYDAASEPKEFVKMRGGHNDAFMVSREVYINKIDSFIEGL